MTKEKLRLLLRLSILAAEGRIPSESESWRHLHELTAEFEAWELDEALERLAELEEKEEQRQIVAEDE